MRQYPQVDPREPGTAGSLALYRHAKSTGLTGIWEYFELRKPYPAIEVRQLGAKERPFALQMLASRDINYHRALSRLSLNHVYHHLLQSVPGLNEPMTITVEEVASFPRVPRKYEDSFITVFPTLDDTSRIERQIDQIRGALRNVSRDTSLDWRHKEIDLTVAFAPRQLGAVPVKEMVGIVAEALPFDVTLGAIACPAIVQSQNSHPSVTR